MATAPRIAIRALKTLAGTPVPKEGFPEAASQTFKKGALVYLNSSGYLVECGTDPTLIMGVATADGGNAAAGAVTQVVELAHPSTLFLGNLDTSGSEGNGTSAQADTGKMYGVVKSSVTGTPWYVDKTETTNKRVIVWHLWEGVQDGIPMAVGDTIPWVVFAFDPAYFQGHHTS